MSMISELVEKLRRYAAMYDLPPYGREIDGTRELLIEAADTIEALSEKCRNSDAETVRHGEWIGTVCSACGESVSFNFDCDYCPKCGAKMDGEAEVQ